MFLISNAMCSSIYTLSEKPEYYINRSEKKYVQLKTLSKKQQTQGKMEKTIRKSI